MDSGIKYLYKNIQCLSQFIIPFAFLKNHDPLIYFLSLQQKYLIFDFLLFPQSQLSLNTLSNRSFFLSMIYRMLSSSIKIQNMHRACMLQKFPHLIAQMRSILLKIKNHLHISLLDYLQVNNLIQGNIKVKMLMEKSLLGKSRQRGHIQQCKLEMRDNCKDDVSEIDDYDCQEYINNLLHGSSIFEVDNKQWRLERCIRMKMREKPRQSLDYIIYICEYEAKQDDKPNHQGQQLNQHQARQKQQFTQHSFYRSHLHPKLVFIKIIPSKPSKCNIQLYNIKGQILKYYSNIFQLKKQGKLLNLIRQFNKSVIIIHDYTKNESTVKVIPTLLHPTTNILYALFNLHTSTPNIIQQISIKIKKQSKGQLQQDNHNIYVRTKRMIKLHRKGLEERILDRITNILEQEEGYLKMIRGQLPIKHVIVAFDAIIVNLWRQFNCSKESLALKINQLFEYKQNQIKMEIIDKREAGHMPKRMYRAQNCSLCNSKEPRVQRPRRTNFICATCSAQNERSFYLCKPCFKSYHQSKDLFIYKKYQKKTKKLRLLAKKKNLKIAEEPKMVQKKQQEVLNQKSSVQQVLLSLDQSMIDKLMKSKKLDSAEFGLQMLVNSLIKCNNKHLEKINSQ